MSETYRFAPDYALPTFPFVRPPELEGVTRRHRIAIVGGGLAGLTLACDLAQRGVEAVLLDEDDTIGVKGASSRGICYAQKSLETMERLGIYARIAEKGVTWSVGKTYSGNEEVYRFNLATDSVSRQPPFINLQQFHLEWFLVDRIVELGGVDLRWKSRVGRVERFYDHARIAVSTPDGDYVLECDWLIDATGANSPIRAQFDLPAQVSRSADRWCITDVRFATPLPMERWTWIEAEFNEGRAVWQHLMADEVWRMDYQMPEDADVAHITKPEVAGERLRAQLGPDVDFEFVWIGPYQYGDHLLECFRHGPILFIGDAAHVVSPFGARGGNSGIQDANNLGWKLALVARGEADPALLDSYDAERQPAAQENLTVTSRTARFMAPRSPAERRLRSAVIALAKRHPFARPLVNTGRMSVANAYPPAPCAPDGARNVQNLAIHRADGSATTLAALLAESTTFVALWPDATSASVDAVRAAVAGRPVRIIAVRDDDGTLAAHLATLPGQLALIRPDGYLAARLDDPMALSPALDIALAVHPSHAVPLAA